MSPYPAPEYCRFALHGGEAAVTEYFGNQEIIEIPDTYEGCPVTAVAEFAFRGCLSLRELRLPEGVREIGQKAFYGCENLRKLYLPSTLTHIGEMAFYSCAALSDLLIPHSVTHIGRQAFAFCRHLTEESKLLPAGTEAPDDVFYRCRAEYVRPHGMFGTAGKHPRRQVGKDLQMLSADAGFYRGFAFLLRGGRARIVKYVGSTSAKEVTVPDKILGCPVTVICRSAFRGLSSLRQVTLPETVRIIGELAFRDCAALADINAPASLEAVGVAAFENCRSLLYFTPAEGLLRIREFAFRGCRSLVEVTLPRGLALLGDRAFFGCKNLTVPPVPAETAVKGELAFGNCKNAPVPSRTDGALSAISDAAPLSTVCSPDDGETDDFEY